MSSPETKKVRAIDVVPGKWGLYCRVGGSEPFVNSIDVKEWSEDGKSIWFMLDTHNFVKADPLDELDLVPIDDDWTGSYKHSEFLAKRPMVTEACPCCNGTGKVPV